MLSDWFTTDLIILSPDQERDSGGAVKNTLAANGSVSGHLYAASSGLGLGEVDKREKIEGERFYKFLCPIGSAISEKNVLGLATADYEFLENQLLNVDYDFQDPTPANNWTFNAANALHVDNYQDRKDVLDFESNTINVNPGIYNNLDTSFDAGDIILIRGEFYFPSTNPGIITAGFRDPTLSYNWVENGVVDQWVFIEFAYTTTVSVSGYKITLEFGDNLGSSAVALGEKVYINKIEAGRAQVIYDKYEVIGIDERPTGDNAHLEVQLKRRI